MDGLEYMNKICPTTSRGKDPNREDVADAFNDGYAMGYEQAEKDNHNKINVVLNKANWWLTDFLKKHYIEDGDGNEVSDIDVHNSFLKAMEE